MPRPSRPPETRLAAVRAYFGLQQQELAALLGIGRPMLAHLEAGRRALTPAVAERLAPFAALLPPLPALAAQLRAEAEAAADSAAPLPPPPPGLVPAGPVQARLAACRREARALRWQLRHLPTQAARAARWAAALPLLRAALPPPPPPHAPATPDAIRLRYLHAWLATVPTALPPEVLAQWHLGRARLQGLVAEMAALEGLTPPAPLSRGEGGA